MWLDFLQQNCQNRKTGLALYSPRVTQRFYSSKGDPSGVKGLKKLSPWTLNFQRVTSRFYCLMPDDFTLTPDVFTHQMETPWGLKGWTDCLVILYFGLKWSKIPVNNKLYFPLVYHCLTSTSRVTKHFCTTETSTCLEALGDVKASMRISKEFRW